MNIPVIPKEQEEKAQDVTKPALRFTISRKAVVNWDRDNEDRAKAKLLKEKLVAKWWAKRGTLGTDLVKDTFSRPMILLVMTLVFLLAYGRLYNILVWLGF